MVAFCGGEFLFASISLCGIGKLLGMLEFTALASFVMAGKPVLLQSVQFFCITP